VSVTETQKQLTKYSYEYLELAGYELLTVVARTAGEPAIVETAQRIAGEERAMAERLAGSFDRAVDASLRAVGADDLQERLEELGGSTNLLKDAALRLGGLNWGPLLPGTSRYAWEARGVR
jgi:rubrerythrin